MTPRLLSKCLSREVSRRLTVVGSSQSSRHMATFRPSILLNEKVTMKVPTMGDSITEGTIVEWAAEVGQGVSEGDVIALIETDKVTIDIKAEVDGVIVEHCGAVEDNVEVGADLYKIDTEGTATITADSEVAGTVDEVSSPIDTVAAATSTTETQAESSGQVRIPSIQFLGRDGWKKKLSIVGDSTPQKVGEPLKPNGSITLPGGALSPMYGRLPFSEREIEALIMGGASELE